MIRIFDKPLCKYIDFELLEDDKSFICRTSLRRSGSFSCTGEALAAESGIDPGAVARIRQTHSDGIHLATPWNLENPETPEADGVILTRPGIFGMIRTADCVPVIIVHPAMKITALVHAGWKGTCNRITQKAISKVLEISSGDPGDLLVFAGPCIHACCYQVGSEVIEAFSSRGHDLDRLITDSRLNLVKANLSQAQESGVSRISSSGFCTSCHPDLYHSYRRDRTIERMLTVAGFIA